MPTSITIALLIAVAATAAVTATRWLRRRSDAEVEASTSHASRGAVAPGGSDIRPLAPYRSEATEEVARQCLKLAFGVADIGGDPIQGEHARVLELAEKALHDAVEQQQYFPRRPLLLPKLLQALNDTDSTRQELVRLILEDPTLAGTTLKRANNAFYRMSAQPVESLDRAVTVLGTDGLRSLASTAILQPVFKLPKGFFDQFADVVWEQAQRSAAGAEAYAEATFDKDPFVAQLLGVLPSLASLVLFRVTLDKYRALSDTLQPRAEVFIRVLQSHRARLAIEIGKTWQLSEASVEALVEQHREISPTRMSQLGSALYYGELAGSVAILAHHGRYAADGMQDLLLQQGLQAGIAPKVLQAAESVDLTV
jgi:HD-like signal output (HDOD) protein